MSPAETKMDSVLKAKWVEALRSGKFEQTRMELANESFSAFCCIGVGYKVCIGDPEVLDHGFVDRTDAAASVLGLTDEQKSILITMNDGSENSFSEIADYIEEKL